MDKEGFCIVTKSSLEEFNDVFLTAERNAKCPVLKFIQGREIFEDLSGTFLPWVPEAFHARFPVSVKS